MPDDRLLKQLLFGMMDESNRRGKRRRRWTVDVEEWCKLNNDLQTLSMKATDRTEWHQMVKYAVDTAVRCSVVGPFLWPAQRPGTRYQTTFESWRVLLTVFVVTWKLFFSRST